MGLFKTLFTICIFALLVLGCSNKLDQKNKTLDWIFENEKLIFDQINITLKSEIVNLKKDSTILYNSYVFTKYDTTILGKLATKIYELDTCLCTQYVIYRKRNKIDLLIAPLRGSQCQTSLFMGKGLFYSKYLGVTTK